jgi:hypothetical protein
MARYFAQIDQVTNHAETSWACCVLLFRLDFYHNAAGAFHW